MTKIKVNENIYKGKEYHYTQYLYFCKGCGYEHAFALKKDGGNHTFNMNLNTPTVSPSLLHNNNPKFICHSFIKSGMIQYLGDCHHKLKGQTIELPEIK